MILLVLYCFASLAVAASAFFNAGWAPGLSAAVASLLAIIAGGGLKASLLWGDRAQKVAGSVIGALLMGIALWLSGGFSAGILGHHLDGSSWCWIGFFSGVIFTSKKTAGFGRIAPPISAPSSPELLDALGELMERYPGAFLDTSRLPAPKSTLKAVIKSTWQREPALRSSLAAAYLHLANFQDGIGEDVIEYKLPDSAAAIGNGADPGAARRLADEMIGPGGESSRKWLQWSNISTKEMEALALEWTTFERETGANSGALAGSTS